MVFQKKNKVEDGRVRAHETAETAAVKVHEIIDKVAEQTELGSERAQELRAAAAEQAATTRDTASARAAELRQQAEEAQKDVKKRRKAAAKNAKKRAKKARKTKDDVSKEVARTGDDLGKDVAEAREKFVGTASGLAAAGVAAGRKAADEAVVRGPEVLAALRDEQDPSAALDAAKGNVKPQKKKGRKRKLLLLAVVAGGVAAVAAKLKQGPKKDPWAVPTGDPYKAPSTGRDSSVAGGLAATGVAPAAEAADAAPADPVTSPEGSATGPDQAEGADAWTTARDWADNSAVPSTTDGAEHADLTPDHLDGDLPVEGDDKL